MKNALRHTGSLPAHGVFFICVAVLSFSFFFLLVHAEEKTYSYKDIYTTFEIRRDATVRVEERQTYSFDSGEFHEGWRDIPLNGVDAITDITVVDGATGRELSFSGSKLDKTSPESWDRYTTYKENGRQIIEWYYNLENAEIPIERTWILSYTLHGALQFGTAYNRLYWNVFSGYSVPVNSASVSVVLPQKYETGDTQGFFYRSAIEGARELLFSPEIARYTFTEQMFSPNESFTVDVAWKKGVPSVSAYLLDFLKMRFGYVFSIIVFLGALVFMGGHFYTEKKKEKRTVIPEYEPPKGIPPLFAELILKECVTPKGFSATIVDLAVRGYIKIIQDEKGIWNRFLDVVQSKKKTIAIIVLVCGAFLATLIAGSRSLDLFSPMLLGVFEFVFLIFLVVIIPAMFSTKKKSYTLKLLKRTEHDTNVQEFEKKYLEELFGEGDTFSLEELKKDTTRQREFSKKIQDIQDDALKEMDDDTKAFVGGGIQKKKYFTVVIVGALFLFGFSWSLGSKIFSSNMSLQSFIAGVSLVSIGLVLWGFLKFEARLSEHGIVLKQKLLGFKMFLGVTEKDRMKTLTPDLFEKYLPYAMIFGVEKKWAHAFEGMHLPPPEWVMMPHAVGAVDGAVANAFSPSAFSTSFSSAFTSAVSSAGASGAAGGGGAGGGGGGGGGGAS